MGLEFSDLLDYICGETGFVNFDTGNIFGLWIEDGLKLDLLAVTARNPGHGQCRRFFAEQKKHRKRIRVLHVDNPILADALARYGFVQCEWFHRGEKVSGMVWRNNA